MHASRPRLLGQRNEKVGWNSQVSLLINQHVRTQSTSALSGSLKEINRKILNTFINKVEGNQIQYYEIVIFVRPFNDLAKPLSSDTQNNKIDY